MGNPLEDPEGQSRGPSASANQSSRWLDEYLAATGKQMHADNTTTVTPPAGAPTDGTAGAGTTQSPVDQALALIKAGKEQDGIVALMQAAQANPNLVNDANFVQALRTVENQPSADGNVFSATPSNSDQSINVPNDTDPNVLVPPSVYVGGLNFLASGDKVDGILYLMQAAASNPDLTQDQTFFGLLQQVETPSSNPTAQTADTSGTGGPTIDSILANTAGQTTPAPDVPTAQQTVQTDGQPPGQPDGQPATQPDGQISASQADQILQMFNDDPSLMANPDLISWLDAIGQADRGDAAPAAVVPPAGVSDPPPDDPPPDQ